MDLELKNKVILISGGAKGIGEAIAINVANEGGIPVIIDPSNKEGSALVSLIESMGKKGMYICKRLDEPIKSYEVILEVIDTYGSIYGVVNNAGKNDGIGLEHGSPRMFNKSVISNLSHYYELAHYALPYLKTTKGSIVNISSKTAITGQGNTSGYAAAKGAQLALTREWAVELTKYQIRVNAVVPAEVHTPQYISWINTLNNPDHKLKEIKERIPFDNRMTTPEEIASMVIFLLSKKASHITGQQMFVDGGYTHLDRALNALLK